MLKWHKLLIILCIRTKFSFSFFFSTGTNISFFVHCNSNCVFSWSCSCHVLQVASGTDLSILFYSTTVTLHFKIQSNLLQIFRMDTLSHLALIWIFRNALHVFPEFSGFISDSFDFFVSIEDLHSFQTLIASIWIYSLLKAKLCPLRMRTIHFSWI